MSPNQQKLLNRVALDSQIQYGLIILLFVTQLLSHFVT